MIVVVDSDILIEIFRARDQNIAAQWALLGKSDSRVLLSPVSVAEIWTGARPAEYDAIDALFHTLTSIPIDVETARKAGDYLRHFKKSHGLALGDALIAAGAVFNKARLWTRNRKHYPMKELTFF